MVNRVIIFVMDSIGIGALPDAESFGDVNVNTLGSIARATDNFNIPNLVKLGLGHIEGIDYQCADIRMLRQVALYPCRQIFSIDQRAADRRFRQR